MTKETIEQLKYILKSDIFIALKMCDILNKPKIAEKLCVLLVQTEYLGYWELVDELNCLSSEIMS
jgi:hypothetical protein